MGDIPKAFTSAEGASDEVIAKAREELRTRLPDDYVAYLRRSNGGEGFVGEAYLRLWRAEELAQFNREYQVNMLAPGLVAFGGDGGGEAFAFDTRDRKMPVVCVPFIGMSLEDAILTAASFTELFTALRNDDD